MTSTKEIPQGLRTPPADQLSPPPSDASEDELKQAKNKVKARVVLGSERPQNRLFNVGGNWLQRREYRTVADDIKSLDDVTVEAVREVLAKYPFSTASTITVGPRKDVRQPG